jgi:hypothetical protein
MITVFSLPQQQSEKGVVANGGEDHQYEQSRSSEDY